YRTVFAGILRITLPCLPYGNLRQRIPASDAVDTFRYRMVTSGTERGAVPEPFFSRYGIRCVGLPDQCRTGQ
ncbi:MAG: hypothetical protein ACOC2H_09945, partial [Spirochaetota bacterium]